MPMDDSITSTSEIIVGYILIIGVFISLVYLWVQTPIYIAKKRGISKGELSTIKILSWLGILFVITWFIALILALIWKPENWVEKNQNNGNILSNYNDMKSLEILDKLGDLKSKGVITDEEFQRRKKQYLAS